MQAEKRVATATGDTTREGAAPIDTVTAELGIIEMIFEHMEKMRSRLGVLTWLVEKISDHPLLSDQEKTYVINAIALELEQMRQRVSHISVLSKNEN